MLYPETIQFPSSAEIWSLYPPGIHTFDGQLSRPHLSHADVARHRRYWNTGSTALALYKHDWKCSVPLKHFLYLHSQHFLANRSRTGKTHSATAWCVRHHHQEQQEQLQQQRIVSSMWCTAIAVSLLSLRSRYIATVMWATDRNEVFAVRQSIHVTTHRRSQHLHHRCKENAG